MQTTPLSFTKKILITHLVRLYGWWRIPILGFLKPTIIELNERRTEIRLPLIWRNKNHLRSMYFGALSSGADIACGLLAFKLIYEKYPGTQMVFKDFEAKFLRRANADVYFVCEDGDKVVDILDKTKLDGKRYEATTYVRAYTREGAEDLIAEFKLTISVKKELKKKIK